MIWYLWILDILVELLLLRCLYFSFYVARCCSDGSGHTNGMRSSFHALLVLRTFIFYIMANIHSSNNINSNGMVTAFGTSKLCPEVSLHPRPDRAICLLAMG